MGLTSLIRRASLSNNPNSPSTRANQSSSSGGKYCSMSKEDPEEVNSEYVNYTVQIPPTPYRQLMLASQTSLTEEGQNNVKP